MWLISLLIVPQHRFTKRYAVVARLPIRSEKGQGAPYSSFIFLKAKEQVCQYTHNSTVPQRGKLRTQCQQSMRSQRLRSCPVHHCTTPSNVTDKDRCCPSYGRDHYPLRPLATTHAAWSAQHHRCDSNSLLSHRHLFFLICAKLLLCLGTRLSEFHFEPRLWIRKTLLCYCTEVQLNCVGRAHGCLTPLSSQRWPSSATASVTSL